MVEELEEARHQLNMHYDYITQGLIIQSRVQYYEEGENNSKYFLNIIKRNKAKSSIRKLKNGEEEIISKPAIMKEIKSFYAKLYSKRNISENTWIEDLENSANIPKISATDSDSLKQIISESELATTLNTFAENKSPGNDGLTVEFYKQFWNSICVYRTDAINEGITEGEMSISQKQSVITLLEKECKDKLSLKK